MRFSVILFLVSLVALSGCKKDTEKQLEEDIAEIKSYLSDNNLTAQSTDSGLHYIIDEPGTGDFPTGFSDVKVIYTGYYPNGNVFDQSPPDGITFGLTNVIEGWQEGIPLFREGGSGTLFIPSELAYGPSGRGDIGGNAVLFFDIELVEIID
ncbi:MAG: FKBP-type peptidyl-prolyl cis-trans isomerase [Flavobacteriales bacterium]